MTNLREQRLREEIEEARMQQQAAEQLGKGIGSMFNSFGQMAEGMQQGNIANQVMNEAMPVPRAQAVDPSMQGPADVAAAGLPGFYTGGVDEMNMRMKMSDMRDQQMRAQAYRDQVDMAKAQHYIKDAQSTWKQTDNKLNNAYKERTAYIKEERLQRDALSKAKDPMQYQSAADALIGLNQAAMDRGIKGVQPIDPQSIPPFMTEEQKAALAAQQQAVTAAQQELQTAQSAPQSGWDKARSMFGLNPDSKVLGIPVTFDSERAIQAAQEKFDMEQKALGAMQGSSPGAAASPVAPSATGATSGASMPTITSQEASAKAGKPIAPGTILTDKNGNRILVN